MTPLPKHPFHDAWSNTKSSSIHKASDTRTRQCTTYTPICGQAHSKEGNAQGIYPYSVKTIGIEACTGKATRIYQQDNLTNRGAWQIDKKDKTR